MSESFFHFTIRCPKCGKEVQSADGFETDDWTEVFVFSGYSAQSARFAYDPNYTCRFCGEKTEVDQLFKEKLVKPENIERVIRYLDRMLPYVVENDGIYDHGWEPDLNKVLYRYRLLFPDNQELKELQDLYLRALFDKKYFTKFEPVYGTETVTSDMIPYKPLLKKVYLPNTVTKIGDEAFTGTKISDLFLPRNVISVGNNACKGCYNLKTVHSSDALTEIGDYAFSGTGITKFFFPDGIRKIGDYAFEKTNLTEVYIPAGCESIGKGAFANCPDLKKITLPRKFTGIDAFFESTDRLQTIEVIPM